MDAATLSRERETGNAAKHRVALIGLGRPRNADDWTGWGMAHKHAQGYNASGKCEIVGLCDIVQERADLFNAEHADNKAQVYADYKEMLRVVQPEIVSVCSWPALHAPMVAAAAQTPSVKAIHCEKPMAPTWGIAKQMAQVCRENNVQLTFDHQRRFLESFQTARNLVQSGAIGELQRMEGACANLFDWGTHWVNMFLFYNNDRPAKWVMAQVDARRPAFVYGVPHDTQGLCSMEFDNGVFGVLFTGDRANELVGCANRLIGTEGTIEVHNESPSVRIRGKGDGALHPATEVSLEGGIHGDKAITRTIAEVVDSLETGHKSLVDVQNALDTTEILFAAYESARRRGRIDFPLDINDSPFAEMIKAGDFPLAPWDESKAQSDGSGGRSQHL